MEKIFAYGALMSETYLRHIGVSSSSRRSAHLPDYSLVFTKQATDHPNKGFATIVPNPLEIVHGIVYDLSPSDIAKIDVTEDYPFGYTRKEVEAQIQTRECTQVMVYIATLQVIKTNLLPTREYLELLCESTDLLPPDYIKRLRTYKTLD